MKTSASRTEIFFSLKYDPLMMLYMIPNKTPNSFLTSGKPLANLLFRTLAYSDDLKI